MGVDPEATPGIKKTIKGKSTTGLECGVEAIYLGRMRLQLWSLGQVTQGVGICSLMNSTLINFLSK